MIGVTTLDEFIIDRQDDFPFATGDLSRLLRDIGFASKIVNREVNKAGLVDISGAAGSENIQGEQQQKLDVFADEVFIKALKSGGEVCGIASEENDDFIAFENESSRNGKYVVAMDPLDGSSNIDVNVSIGTIFSIFRRKSEIGSLATMEDFLQPGTEQVAGGYVLYGSSSMLVYTTGNGVNGFTLDPSIGEYCLSHAGMKTAENGKIYSMNEGNYFQSHKGIQKYLDKCKEDRKTARYIGSLVADFHRNLIKGGVYLYPGTTSAPSGKLRLLYECNPLAFIVEQAGGKASDGDQRIMEIVPRELHQRCPYFVGSKNMVEEIEGLLK
ncbi:MAG: class 1 fructose-bisphosphatase [Crocinitomicaceae bacterium]|nr:class 1 fructose-bisphosphatase [Crocinitomicaceae bacterium]|tara:strand:- start:3087 stop:4067 length:981 start_codon:yes stop_codon:yes gene_type:complete